MTPAEPKLSEALRAAFEARGIAASTAINEETDLIVLTEGLDHQIATTERHWSALDRCRELRSRKVPIILLGLHNDKELSKLSGLKGLSRTLRQEWPESSISTVDVSVKSSVEDIAYAILMDVTDATLTNGDSPLLAERLSDAPSPLPTASSLSEGGNWLITGGGRGVTAACAIELARNIQSGTFFLLGRSELLAWPEGLPVQDDLKSLRGALIELAKLQGEKPRPASIDKRARALLAGQEVRRTLKALKNEGLDGRYIPLDISNKEEVRKTINKLESTHGPITGLVHGAGVLADRLATLKTETDVVSVFAPKVDGLLNLMDALDLRALRHCGLFSSAAAVYGNPGQSDYAMANAWLNTVAQRLHATQEDLTVKSFCWGPWAGGMVDATLAAHFEDRGIPLIGLQEGAEIFAHHMLYGDRDAVNLLVGDSWQS